MPKNGPAHIGEERLHQVEPGLVLGHMDIFEAIGAWPDRPGFPGRRGRVVVQEDSDVGKTVGVEILQKGNELPTSMLLFDPGRDMAVAAEFFTGSRFVFATGSPCVFQEKR